MIITSAMNFLQLLFLFINTTDKIELEMIIESFSIYVKSIEKVQKNYKIKKTPKKN